MARPDINVFSSKDQLVMIVEIKGGKEDKPEEIERARRMLMDFARTIEPQFFLLAQRNGLFLWEKGAGPGAKPKTASVKSVLREYARSTSEPEQSLRGDGLELVIRSWLDDLALGIRPPKQDVEADQLLVSNGIYNQIRNGRVSRQSLQ